MSCSSKILKYGFKIGEKSSCTYHKAVLDPKSLRFRNHIPKVNDSKIWLLTLLLFRSHTWLYSRIIAFKSHENTPTYVDTVNIFKKLTTSITQITPRWPLTPLLWTLPKDYCVQCFKKYITACGYSDLKKKTLIKVINPYMTFDSTSVEVTCVTLPKDIMSKFHGNMNLGG